MEVFKSVSRGHMSTNSMTQHLSKSALKRIKCTMDLYIALSKLTVYRNSGNFLLLKYFRCWPNFRSFICSWKSRIAVGLDHKNISI